MFYKLLRQLKCGRIKLVLADLSVSGKLYEPSGCGKGRADRFRCSISEKNAINFFKPGYRVMLARNNK